MITFENIKNNTVLLRADLNDSIENNILQNTDRIDEAIGTVKELLSRGNKIILISHLSDNNQSLLPVANYISKNINAGEFEFLSSINREEISIYIKNNINPHNNLKIVLLENLRMFDLGVEEKNDMLFGKWLSMLSDIFIFDAFSVAHREHASVVGVSEYITHTLGPIAMREEKMLSNVIKEKDNTLFIIGGAKISTKLSLIENLLDNGGTVYLGGAMANTILYKKNIDIKDSIIEKDIIISDKVLKNKNLIIPEHYTWGNTHNNGELNMILDIGKEERVRVEKLINTHNNIIWNGPMGYYEGGFVIGTEMIIELINNKNNKNIIAGGGDTITTINNWKKKYKKDFNISYLSLSGGAMLTFLEKGQLPGIEKNR